MKKTLIFSIAIVVVILSACNNVQKSTEASGSPAAQNFNLDTTSLKSGDTFYQCPMNPEVISDQTGVCPKCGMDLEKKAKK